VDGISLGVARGECYGLLGPNGAGKTTVVEMLEGINPPSAGRVLYRGQPINRDYRTVIGIQFQETALQDYLSCRETLQMFSGLYPAPLPIATVAGMCALDEFLERDTRRLSGGQRQRLLLAIALINDPQILFLDEPTTGLDPQARHNFWRLIEGIKQAGKTVLLTTHYMEEAERLCDRVAIIDHGKIVVEGVPAELLAAHFDGVLVRLPASAASTPLPFTPTARNGQLEFQVDHPADALRELLARGVPLDGLHIHHPTLEDLFLKLTGHALRS
jgi:ABC-2 type transport system ATP-binding protein